MPIDSSPSPSEIRKYVDDLLGDDAATAAGRCGDDVLESAAAAKAASAEDLIPTNRMWGASDKATTDVILDSLNDVGWQGESIVVAELDGKLYILDGHHRVLAAEHALDGAGLPVPYRVALPEEYPRWGFANGDAIQEAAEWVWRQGSFLDRDGY